MGDAGRVLISLLTFSFAAFLVVLLPGPDTLVVLRSLLRSGKAAATRTVAGVLTGLTVWAIAASIGLAALLRASSDAYLALRIVGAVYLCVLGVQALRSRGASNEFSELGEVQPRRKGLLGTGYGAGLTTDLLNPKVGVFFVTFLPAFVPHGKPVGAVSLLFGAIFVAETAAYFALLLGAAERVVAALRVPRLRRRLDRATGAVLIGFGVRLATEP
jgi:threonine/homoserine/homoserine lactone efflux protein